MTTEPNIIVSCDPAGIVDSREMRVFRAWESIDAYTHTNVRRFDDVLYGQIGTEPIPPVPEGMTPSTLAHSEWLLATIRADRERAIAVILEHEPKLEFVGRIEGEEIFVDKDDMTW